MKRLLYQILFLLLLFTGSSPLIAQEGLQVMLRADDSLGTVVMQNEPVLFTVTVLNKAAQADPLWNASADRRIRQLNELEKQGKIKKEEADRERSGLEKGKRSSASITLGSEKQSWTSQLKWVARNKKDDQSIPLPVKLMANPVVEQWARLDGSRMLTACFAITAADMAGIPAGNYEISVSAGDHTDKVDVTIRPDPVNPTAMTENQLIKFSRYYWHAGDGGKMLEYTGMLLKKNPVSVSGLSLTGDAQFMLADYEKALFSYQEAVRNYNKQNGEGAEPPEYLLSMIGLVKEKMGK